MSGLEEFLWADEATEATVAVIDASAVSAAALVGRLGPAEPRGELGFRDALELAGTLYDDGSGDRLAVVQADRLPGRGKPWWVTVEPNGFRASLPGPLALLSAGASAASFFWNVNAVMRFMWIEAGAVRVEFDPLLEPDAAPAEGAGLDFESHPRAAAMGLLQRLSGVALTDGWFHGAKPTFLVNAPLG